MSLLSFYSVSGDNCSDVISTPFVVVRREEIKERLREKLELEKRALQVVERLLEDCVAEDFLVDCVSIIQAQFY